jgi:hypothetical protein
MSVTVSLLRGHHLDREARTRGFDRMMGRFIAGACVTTLSLPIAAPALAASMSERNYDRRVHLQLRRERPLLRPALPQSRLDHDVRPRDHREGLNLMRRTLIALAIGILAAAVPAAAMFGAASLDKATPTPTTTVYLKYPVPHGCSDGSDIVAVVDGITYTRNVKTGLLARCDER